MRSSVVVLCQAAALLIQGCGASTEPLKRGASEARKGQLCRFELGRCDTMFPADLAPSEAVFFSQGAPAQP